MNFKIFLCGLLFSTFCYADISQEGYSLKFDDEQEARDLVRRLERSGGPKSRLDKSRHIKVAIDAGHLGGDYSLAEWKFVNSSEHPDDRILSEGDLNLRIAKKIEDKLKRAGIKTFMTRENPGESPLGPFESWIKNNRKVNKAIKDKLLTVDKSKHNATKKWYDQRVKKVRSLLKRKPDALKKFFNTTLDERKMISSIFGGLYLSYDRTLRAKRINDFRPDLTVVIHLNSHQGSLNNDFTTNLTDGNQMMAFIAGGFTPSETQSDEDYRHLSRIYHNPHVTGKSVGLCSNILEQLSLNLNIPYAKQESETYLEKYTVSAHDFMSDDNDSINLDGIFARNLTLTKLIESPLCYTESLYYTNQIEVTHFMSDDNIESRLESIAVSHSDGILNFLQD